MNRTKITYLIIMSTLLSIILFWVAEQVYRQSTVYYLTESKPFDSQVFASANFTESYHSDQLELGRNSASTGSTVKPNERSNFKILPKATADNLVALCNWTGQRLLQLDKAIRISGAGSNSQYCEEYDLRRRELATNQCSNARLKNFQEFC